MNQVETKNKITVRLLLTSILVVLLSSFLASWIQSSGGRVQVQDIKIPTQNGQWVVADLYKPRSATSENPAPMVVVIPGFQRSKEALANVAIEFSRRGIVAILIDPYAQGFSSASMSRMAALPPYAELTSLEKKQLRPVSRASLIPCLFQATY